MKKVEFKYLQSFMIKPRPDNEKHYLQNQKNNKCLSENVIVKNVMRKMVPEITLPFMNFYLRRYMACMLLLHIHRKSVKRL